MIKITDETIGNIAELMVENSAVELFYLLFDEVNVGSLYYEVSTVTKDGFTATLNIDKLKPYSDFIEIARTFDVDQIIDSLRYDQRETTIELPSIEVMLDNYNDFKQWLNRIADILVTVNAVEGQIN